MKSFKKLSVLIVLFAFIAPNLAFASWWNPISWFNNWTFSDKTEVLENKIRELEDRINSVSSTTNAEIDVSVITASSTIEQGTVATTSSSQKPSASKTIQPVPKTQISIPNIPAPVISQTAPIATRDYEALYKEITKKFFDFRYAIKDEKDEFDEIDNPTNVEKDYKSYLAKTIVVLTDNIDDLVRIEETKPKPQDKVDSFVTKYNQIKADYDLKYKQYKIDDAEEAKYSQARAEQERRNSPECKEATAYLKAINAEIKPIQDKIDEYYDDYLKTGNLHDDSALYHELAPLSLRQTGLQNKYYAACENFYPTLPKTYNTSCYNIAGTINCTTY